MARASFGGSASDYVYDTVPNDGYVRFGAATLTLWDAETGGGQYTDLLLEGSLSLRSPSAVTD